MDGMRNPENLPPDTELPEFAQATQGDSIGVVEVSNGNTFITRVDGAKTSAKVGDPIFQGDLIETDTNGSIGILFSDDSVFSLAEEGQMVIDEMIYNPGTQEGSASFNIAAGVFTFVSGQIAKTAVDAMQVETPTATIGIRGTAGAVRIGKNAPDTYTLLAEGGGDPAANGQAADDTLLAQAGGPPPFFGEMLVSNGVGSQSLSQVNATTQVSSPFSPPTIPIIMPLAAIQQAYASAAAALPPSPIPVNLGGGPNNNDDGNQNTNDDDGGLGGGPGGLTEGEITEEETDLAAQNAAADAFEQALAAGGTLEDAMAAAAGAATETRIEAALTADPNVFGSAAAISSVIEAQLSNSLGGLGTGASDPLDSGTGSGSVNEENAQDILDEIISESLNDAQQATEDVIAEMVADGLLDSSVLTSVQGLFDSLQGTDLFDFGTDPSADFAGGGFDGFGPGGGPGDPFGDIFQNTFDDLFNDLFTDILDAFVDDTEDATDDFVLDLADDVADTSVTVSTADIAGSTFTFVPDQNDIIVNDTANSTTSLYLAGEAESGDEYRGASGQTDDLFFDDPGSDVFAHVLRLTDVNSLGFSSLIMGTAVDLQIDSAGDMSFSMGSYGDIAIAGTSSDGFDLDQHWTFTGGIDGSNNTLSLTGSGGNDTITFGSSTTNVIAGVTGVEKIDLNNSSVRIQSSISGVTVDGDAGSDLEFAGASGNSVSVATSATLGALIGSTGTDTVDLAYDAAVSNVTDIDYFTHSDTMGNANLISFGAGGQTSEFEGNIDSIVGGSGNDTFTLDGTVGTLTDGGGTNDTLVFSGTGSTANDVAGWETITGGSGSHSLNWGTGNDSFTLTGALALLTDDGGTDTLTFGSAGGSVSSLLGIETIVGGTGTDSFTIADNVGNNVFTVKDVEVITGGSGNDQITFNADVSGVSFSGGSSTDQVTFQGANTNSISLSSVESVVGGSGNDTVFFTSAVSSTTVNLGADTSGDSVQLGNFTNDLTVINVETISGGSGADTITVSGATNNTTIIGNAGNDTITGGTGDDLIQGKADNDIIVGGDGADTLQGGGGSDSISGGVGDDIITGGSSTDTLTGGTGADTFIYNSTTEFGDTITDFSFGSGSDVVDFNVAVTMGSNLATLASGALSSGEGLVLFTPDISTNVSDGTTVGSEIQAALTLTNAANKSVLFIVDDANLDVALWYWDDTTAGIGDGDGVIDSGEFTQVALLDNTNAASIHADNFEGFT